MSTLVLEGYRFRTEEMGEAAAMDAPLDLYGASRAELIALIGHPRDENADLRREQTRLTAELAAQRRAIVELTERVGALLAASDPPPGDDPPSHPTGMPGLKPTGRNRAW